MYCLASPEAQLWEETGAGMGSCPLAPLIAKQLAPLRINVCDVTVVLCRSMAGNLRW